MQIHTTTMMLITMSKPYERFERELLLECDAAAL